MQPSDYHRVVKRFLSNATERRPGSDPSSSGERGPTCPDLKD